MFVTCQNVGLLNRPAQRADAVSSSCLSYAVAYHIVYYILIAVNRKSLLLRCS